MQKLLIIDDEEAMRRLLRINLSDSYEVIDTGDPEQGLALAMQNKPSAILLDLRMPRFSGFMPGIHVLTAAEASRGWQGEARPSRGPAGRNMVSELCR